MRRLYEFFFDLSSMPQEASALELTWARPLPGWAWLLLGLAALGMAGWCYGHLKGPRWARVLLAGVRALTLLFVVALISGPQITWPRELVEEDLVITLVDRSASMQIADVTGPNNTRLSREAQLQKTLKTSERVWGELASRSELRWVGFSAGVFPIESTTNGLPTLEPPEGWRTDLSASIQHILESTGARPVSGFVVLSDGASSTPLDREMVRALQQRSIGVHVVPLGSSDPMHDLSVGQITAPSRAFNQDLVPVHVQLGLAGSHDGDPVTVRLLRADTGELVDRRTIVIDNTDSTANTLVLQAKLEDPGDHRLVVEIDSGNDDLVGENNRRELSVEVVSRPIRVLYIEGYPRWEYRYLKNILVRESSIESSIMLLSADRSFAQEGNTPLARLPRTAEEFKVFDLIIIGDVPAGFLSTEQLQLVADQVAQRGGGLFWISGSRNMPSGWATTPLADLLPMRPPFDLLELTAGVIAQPTELANRLGVLRLDPDEQDGWPTELSNPETGWSRLHSVRQLLPEQLKPTAEVLAFGTNQSEQTLALLLSMRFGAGQVLFASMDDVWRWRFGRGERWTERWWIGLVRMLARQAIDAAGGSIRLHVEPEILIPGATARVVLSVIDGQLAERLGDLVTIEIQDPTAAAPIELELLRITGGSTYTGDWFPDELGRHSLRVVDPLLRAAQGVDEELSVTVLRPDDEFLTPAADHSALEALAQATGGEVLGPDNLEKLIDALPNRELTVEDPVVIPIWNTGTMFTLALVLLTVEWLGRRLIRLI